MKGEGVCRVYKGKGGSSGMVGMDPWREVLVGVEDDGSKW